MKPGDTVTEADLAALLAVSTRRVRQLAEQGVLERIERGRYELGASIRALMENAAGNGSELQRERIRKLRADATRAELELARERNEVAPIEQMESIWNTALATIRANMLNIPQRVVTQIIGETNEARMKAALTAEIKMALVTAAEAEIETNSPNDDEKTHDNDQ